jgi:hypothetical protein
MKTKADPMDLSLDCTNCPLPGTEQNRAWNKPSKRAKSRAQHDQGPEFNLQHHKNNDQKTP